MQLLRVIVSRTVLFALLPLAQMVPDNNLDWSNGIYSADLDTLNNHEAENLFSDTLFSDTDPAGLAWDPNISLEGSSSPSDFWTDVGVNNNNDIADGGGGSGGRCLSSLFQNSLSTDGLQARSSPDQCTDPNGNSNPGSTTSTSPTTNSDQELMNVFENGNSAGDIKPDLTLCPYERFGIRQLPVCDSGSHDDVEEVDDSHDYDVVEDDVDWIINLKDVTPCMYTSLLLLCVSNSVCLCLHFGTVFSVFVDGVSYLGRMKARYVYFAQFYFSRRYIIY